MVSTTTKDHKTFWPTLPTLESEPNVALAMFINLWITFVNTNCGHPKKAKIKDS